MKIAQTKRLFLATALLLAIAACKKYDLEDDVPECLKETVKEFVRYNRNCLDARADEYLVQGGRIYIFNPGPCGFDRSSVAFDSNCNQFGNIHGLGSGPIAVGDSFIVPVFVRNVWSRK